MLEFSVYKDGCSISPSILYLVDDFRHVDDLTKYFDLLNNSTMRLFSSK